MCRRDWEDRDGEGKCDTMTKKKENDKRAVKSRYIEKIERKGL